MVARVRKYEFMNEPTGTGSLGSNVFVYVLMLNLRDGVPPRPFHVGLTTNLAAALNSQRYVVWHNLEFARPVKVFVLGVVRREVAEQAVADLRFQLLAEGYWLTGSGVPEDQDVRRRRFYELLQYSQRNHDAQLLPRWRDKWLANRGAVEKAPVRQPEVQRGISKREVAGYVGRHPVGDKPLQALLVKLADAYDGRSREARLVLDADELALLERPRMVSLFSGYWNRVVAAADGATVFTLNGAFASRVRADTARVQRA